MKAFSTFGSMLAVLALLGGVAVYSPDARAQSTFNAAVVQSPSTDTGNFTKMQALATQAKAQGAALIIFPEASVFGWLNPAVFTQAAPIPGRALCPMPIRPMTPAF